MDSAHPIPQNVTSFQFHLVGDMTLKQFIYLAIGAGTAYLLFVFLTPIYPLLAWPLLIISTCLGVAFAFLPIASRPLDYWMGAYFRAIYSPTKRVWKKNGKEFKSEPTFNNRLMTYFTSLQSKPSINIAPLPPIPQIIPKSPPVLPSSELPSKDELAKTVDLARQAQNLQFKIIQSERAISQIKSNPQTGDINQVMTNLNTFVSQASEVRQQLDQVGGKPEIQPIATRVKVVIPPKLKQTQLALTTFPNVINGIIKDKPSLPDGNLGASLEGVVAVIYDKEGLPVRALKTNKLGQFSGSTPLPNGTYTLELEKDGFSFDVLQIELSGEVLSPLLITPKEGDIR